MDHAPPLSFKFCKVLNTDLAWLSMDPEEWEGDESYRNTKEFVRTVKVTNDVAERGVKMASDYATLLTKDDTMRAWILQGVEKSRRTYPDFKKETLNIKKLVCCHLNVTG